MNITYKSFIITLMLFAICLIVLVAAPMVTHAEAIRFYVSPFGKDTWSGKFANSTDGDGPFATLERARDEIRKIKQEGPLPQGGISVGLRGGTYELNQPFELTAEDSGTESAPIIYQAFQGEEVQLTGGKKVTNFELVTDADVLERLPEVARGKVLRANLGALKITDLGEVAETNKQLELFSQNMPMTLSRWPNEGFVNIVDLTGGKPFKIRGREGDKIGELVYQDDRPKRWLEESDLWLHGYWFWDWAEERQKVESIDTVHRVISLAPPYHRYGYRKGQWYYAFNALAELDMPGEWYLDRQTSVLYFWPPSHIDKDAPTVSILSNLLLLKDVSYVTFKGLTLEAVRGRAVFIRNGTANKIINCTFRNIGGGAVTISGGSLNGVLRCDISLTGQLGISLKGGDRKTLTPARHFAENNHIHHYARLTRMKQPAIALYGVGNRASHNLIHDAPHQGIFFSGNDHIIEFNEIHNVCQEANDAGAIYAGRDWTMRGTVIRYNYLHDIKGLGEKGASGVYLDDMFCGTHIYGNVFHRVIRPILIGGGRDNTVENNIFVESPKAIHVDERALTWASPHVNTTMKTRLGKVPYKQPPWSNRYPVLVYILEDEPAAPKGNIIVRNIIVGGRWNDITTGARPYVKLIDNLIDQDPHFVDAEGRNFQIKNDSPAYNLGFQRIPIEKIGRYSLLPPVNLRHILR